MSIHTYRRKKNGEVVRVKSVDTISKLKKRRDCVHSITAVTSDIKSDFLDYFWKDSEIVKLAREHTDWSLDQLQEARWGYRTHPGTGEQITSSQYGTEAHESVENALIALKEGADYHDDYTPLTKQFVRYLQENCIEPEHMELKVLDERRAVGGTIDFVAKDFSRLYEIYDFKFRTSTRAYDKDMVQLSIAADIVMKEQNLSYLPKTYSVVFDCGKDKMAIKEWTERERWEGVQWFDDQNKCFMRRHGLI